MNRPLRIAVFLGSFPVVSETFILRQIAGLLDLGHEVDFYADAPADRNAPIQSEVTRHRLEQRCTFMNLPPEAAPWELPAWPPWANTWPPGAKHPVRNFGRLVRAIPLGFTAALRSPGLALQTLRPAHYAHQAASLSALHRLARLARIRKRYDVLHAHFGPTGNSYRFARRLWRAPLLVSFHGYDVTSLPRKSGPGLYDRLFRELDGVTVNSEFQAARLKELGCPAERLHKVPYGVEVSSFAPSPEPRDPAEPVRVVTVGRLVEKKGIEFSLRAFARARGTCPRMMYEIVGDGPLRGNLSGLIDELALREAVVMHGAAEGAAVRALLSRAHLFVLASVTAADGDQEGTPVSLLEAQAAGLPVLSTRHAGIPEVVLDGETGFLVPERDVDGLAERMAFLASHPEACAVMGARGREFAARRFDLAATLQQLLRVYGALEARWNDDARRA